MVTVKDVATQFRRWSLAQARAYRAGACAGVRGTTVQEGFEYDPTDDELEDDLTLYFFRGYADALGQDATGEDWFEEISDWRISYRWWEGK